MAKFILPFEKLTVDSKMKPERKFYWFNMFIYVIARAEPAEPEAISKSGLTTGLLRRLRLLAMTFGIASLQFPRFAWDRQSLAMTEK